MCMHALRSEQLTTASHTAARPGNVDFKTDPWPKISDAAKDCVKILLDQDPTRRATATKILRHDWLIKEGVALDITLDSVVLKRMRQFAQMNKLKKMCLMVVGQHLSADEIAGGWGGGRATQQGLGGGPWGNGGPLATRTNQ